MCSLPYGLEAEGTGGPQPASELKIDAEYLAECTGCDPTETVAFLLAGWIPEIPWINIDWESDIPQL